MQTLLIFSEIVETHVDNFNGSPHVCVLLPDGVAPEWLPLVDGLILNASPCSDEQASALDRVADALADDIESCLNPDDPLACQWVQYEIEPMAVIEGPVRIIRCGIVV